MSNAKHCDICGKFFKVPEIDYRRLEEDHRHLNLIRMHQALPEGQIVYREEPWLQFDACEKCYQNLLDYILSSAAESSGKDAE